MEARRSHRGQIGSLKLDPFESPIERTDSLPIQSDKRECKRELKPVGAYS